MGVGKVKGSASSSTQAAITGMAGNTQARTGDAATGLAKAFDAQKVQQTLNAQVKITQQFARNASQLVKEHSTAQRKALQQQLKAAKAKQEANKEIEKTNDINNNTANDTQLAQIQSLQEQINRVNFEERVLNILVGAVTGTGSAAVGQAALSQAADQMRQLMIENSKRFAGVTDGVTVITNESASSAGVRGDGVKVGGTRIDLDLLCGRKNERCITNVKGELVLNEFGYVRFEPEAAGVNTMQEFIEDHPDGKQMVGATGGIQGMKGTLFGRPYGEGSWQDQLIEAFSGSHDMIGGQLSGLYDEQGNARRGRGNLQRKIQDGWSATGAIVLSSPFAAAELLPSQVWQGISILLHGAK